VPFIPILVLNLHLYGSPFTTGYALLHEGGAVPTEFAAGTFPIPASIRAVLAPFGWNVPTAWANAWQYLVVPYGWFMGLAAIGMCVTRRHRALRIGTLVLTAWLILYYGSWTIADPLVRATNVFTISYARYWLPITIALAPWAALGVRWIVNRVPRGFRIPITALLIGTIASLAFTQMITDPTEGLLRQRQAIDEHRTRARAVIAHTERDAVIVSQRMDKVFFPERTVVHASDDFAGDAAFRENLRALVDHAPIYWYATGDLAMPGFALAVVPGAPFGERLFRMTAATE
jgi:hypothetical protein